MLPQGQKKTLFYVLGIVAFMLGLSFASVPLYDLFCRVTGWGGTTQRALAAPSQIVDRDITVRFDGSVAKDMPWEFHPVQNEMKLKLGQERLAFFRAHNPTNERIVGVASFNVLPMSMGKYFDKIECFCFTEQVLEPGQSVDMPVSFFVDPDMMNDPQAKRVTVVTLSYSFFRAKTSATK